MHYWNLHIGDWMKATARLSPSEVGIYLRLLNHYYDTEIPLPLGIKDACRIAGTTSKAEQKQVEFVLCEFFDREEDGWYNKRANAEIAKLHDKSEKAAKSAAARWDRRNANAMRTQCERNANGYANGMRMPCDLDAPQTPSKERKSQKPQPEGQFGGGVQ